MLQDKEDEQARNDGREPRTVRVWPLHADDLASNKLFGLSTERMTKRQHEKALAQLATEGRLLPTTGIRREMHYLYNGMSRHLGLTTNGEPEPITGGLAQLIAMAQEAQTPVWYLRCNSEWRPIVMAEPSAPLPAAKGIETALLLLPALGSTVWYMPSAPLPAAKGIETYSR